MVQDDGGCDGSRLLNSTFLWCCLLCCQVKATEQYFPVVLFIMLYKVVLPLESLDQILKCDHSNESN